MRITDLTIDPKSLGTKFLLVGVAPVNEYKDGTRTNNVSGYRYTVVLPDKKMEKIGVKIEGAKLMDEPEGYVEVSFRDLEIYFYFSNKEPQVGARAKGIALANQKA